MEEANESEKVNIQDDYISFTFYKYLRGSYVNACEVRRERMKNQWGILIPPVAEQEYLLYGCYNISHAEEQLVMKVLDYGITNNYLSIKRIMKIFGLFTMKAGRILEILLQRGYIENDDDFRFNVVVSREEYIKLCSSENINENLLTRLSEKYENKTFDDENKDSIRKYTSMLDSDFNMDMAIRAKRHIKGMAVDILKTVNLFPFIIGGEWNEEKIFISVCMKVLNDIVCKRSCYSRFHGTYEAARQLAAVIATNQSSEVCNVHSRVLYELNNTTDKEYEHFKRKILKIKEEG